MSSQRRGCSVGGATCLGECERGRSCSEEWYRRDIRAAHRARNAEWAPDTSGSLAHDDSETDTLPAATSASDMEIGVTQIDRDFQETATVCAAGGACLGECAARGAWACVDSWDIYNQRLTHDADTGARAAERALAPPRVRSPSEPTRHHTARARHGAGGPLRAQSLRTDVDAVPREREPTARPITADAEDRPRVGQRERGPLEVHRVALKKIPGFRDLDHVHAALRELGLHASVEGEEGSGVRLAPPRGVRGPRFVLHYYPSTAALLVQGKDAAAVHYRLVSVRDHSAQVTRLEAQVAGACA